MEVVVVTEVMVCMVKEVEMVQVGGVEGEMVV